MVASDPTPVIEGRAGNGGSRPVPDPTELTDRAIAKAQAQMRDYVDGQVAIRDERLRGIDEATKLRLSQVDYSEEINEKVGFLERLHDEKFTSIATQFKERDTRAERESRDNKVAVDAAFAAQKEAAANQDKSNREAIDKSERATSETIKTNQELSKATTDALTKSLDEVKLAVNSIQSTKLGSTETKASIYAVVGAIGGGGIIGIILLASGALGA